MKKIFYSILLILSLILLLKACIRADIPFEEEYKYVVNNSLEDIKYPKDPENVTINGVDYLQSQAEIGKFGGTLITSSIGEGPKTFNPYNSTDATSSSMADLMFDGLFSSNPVSGEIIPRLAKSYEINDLDYIIHLRKGVKWSDNKPITASDVVFTWNDIIFAGLGNTSIRDSVVIDGKLPKIQKIDDYTVKFTLPKQFAPFLRILSASIVPKHVFEPAVKKGAKYFNSFYSTTTLPENFVVSGAFKLSEYKAAQRVVFRRNPNYYMINKNAEKLPYLDKLVYLIVGDLNNEILKFEAKEIDLISLRGSNVARYKMMEAKSDYRVYSLGADTGTLFTILNLNTRKNENGKHYVELKKQAWFNDLNFRTAIDYAIDRKNMMQNVANGLAQPLFTAESLNSIYLNKNIKGHQRDLTVAENYLKKSGFYKDKKGVLYDKYGNKVEFDLYTNAGNTEREALGVMIKQDLKDLGIQINFKPIEFNSLVNKMTSSLDWDMLIMGLTGSPLEPHNGKNVWASQGSLHLFNQRLNNESDLTFWEKRLDEIFDEASLKPDFASRKELYDEYQQIVYDKKPIIYLYSPIRTVAIRKKFKNIYPSSLSGVVYNLEEIYVDK